jgi:formamidopyrimidine-DNA glycosylase
MPELPEVETVVRSIRPGIVGRTITNIRVGRKKLRQPWSKQWSQLIVDQRIVDMSRRGKWIIVKLDAGALLAHLGMTGQLTVGPANRTIEPHTHLVFDLGADRQLRYRDERRFGSVRYFVDPAKLTAFLNDRLGPEPFAIDPDYWQSALSATNRSIKAALLDQSIIAGVGNIYADESLFAARIHPTIAANRLTPNQATVLGQAVAKVLTFAIERRGSSIRDYLDGNGERGQFQNEFRVYGRFKEPCRKCRTAIERIRLAGRSTHYCPKCQPLSSAKNRAH